MSEQKSNLPEPDRYSVEHARLDEEEGGGIEAALQRKLNEGSAQSWRLMSVVHDPTGEGVLIVWDLQGMISG